MDLEHAATLLRKLADGHDPIGDEPLAPDNPCQQAPVVRALYLATQAVEYRRAMQEKRNRRPELSGQRWTEDEDRRLGQAFDKGTSLTELAREHRRSRWAIQARLAKLGRIAASASPFGN